MLNATDPSQHEYKHNCNEQGSNNDGSGIRGNYSLARQIGQGSYGAVWEGYNIQTGEKVAVKIVSLKGDKCRARRLLREIRILRTLKGLPSIVTLHDVMVYPSESSAYLVFEFASVDLYKLQTSPQCFTEAQVSQILYQILLGLQAIHSRGLIHRDIKPANLLLNAIGECKICDFGLSRSIVLDDDEHPSGPMSPMNWSPCPSKSPSPVRGHRRQLSMHVVTRWYRPPEVILLQQQYTSAVDMWSLGCVLADLLHMVKANVQDYTRRSPIFPGSTCYPLTANDRNDWSNNLDQLNVIFNIMGTPKAKDIAEMDHAKAEKYLKSLPPKDSQDLRNMYPAASTEVLDLLTSLLEFNPLNRVTAKQAIEHPFFKNLHSLPYQEYIDHPVEKVVLEFEDFDYLYSELVELLETEATYFDTEESMC